MKLTDLLNDLQQACIALHSEANFKEIDSDYFYILESDSILIKNYYFTIRFTSLQRWPDVELSIHASYDVDWEEEKIYTKTLHDIELIDWTRLMEFIDKKINQYIDFKLD